MPVDTDYLQHYYSSLSGEALQEIDRADLTGEAQQYYDKEFASRKLDPLRAPTKSVETETPDWLSEASEVFSVTDRPGEYAGKDAEKAREVLETAGIPSFLDIAEDYVEDETSRPIRRWRISVPGRFNMRATSILDRDIFNDEFESNWKTHLEMLTDQELNDTQPNYIFCGLYDRIERVERVYNDELSRRGSHK